MLMREDHWDVFFFLKNWGDGDVIGELYLSRDLKGVSFPLVGPLGPSSEPAAVPGSLFKEITESLHLCCIMGSSERPCSVDIPARRRSGSFLTPK